jgi:hypothetical protein
MGHPGALGAFPAGWPNGGEGALAAEAVVFVCEKGIFGQDLVENADNGRVIQQFLQGALVALASAGIDLGLHRLDFAVGQHRGQQDPAVQVEEKFLFCGHGYGWSGMV